jgi:hypothetical protein
MKRFPLLTDTRQSTEYSCGAAALQAVLHYWGKDFDEQQLMQLLHTSPETGTYVGDIARVARELGMKAEVKENLSLTDLHDSLRKGIPVITCGQAWRSREDSDKSVQEDWEDGHYIVVIGMDTRYIYYQDPFIKRGKVFVTHQMFEDHWHNVRGKTSGDTKKQFHLGVFISGDSRPRHHPLSSVDITEELLAKIGPLELMVIRFPGIVLPYALLEHAKGALNHEFIRPVSYFLLNKDPQGNIGVLEGGELDEQEAVEFDAIIGYLIGLGAGGTAAAREYAGIAGQRAAGNTFGISEKDLRKITEDLPPSSSTFIVVLEHMWVRRVREALTPLGGYIASQGMITPELLEGWGARLREEQEASGSRKPEFITPDLVREIVKKD